MRSAKQQHVIEKAYEVFLRYGYARTTMADLAKAAGLSRPALYLVFPDKEDIFSAVVEWANERSLKAIREGLKSEWALEKKLLYTLELSIGQGYDTIAAHPDAEDLLLLNCGSPAIEAGYAKLQGYLAELLRKAVKSSNLTATPEDVARTLLSSMRGFKLAASDGRDLRRLMAMQVSLTVAALGHSGAPRAVSSRGRTAAVGKKDKLA